jgi:predicted RNase H-like nuclease (RuvC/YqgF family)
MDTRLVFSPSSRRKGRKGIPRCAGKSAAKIARYWNSGKRRKRKIRTLKREISKLEQNPQKNAKGLAILRERVNHWQKVIG